MVFIRYIKLEDWEKIANTLTRKKRIVICMVDGVTIHLYVRHIRKNGYEKLGYITAGTII